MKDIFGLHFVIGRGVIIRIWQQDMNSLFQLQSIFIFASISCMCTMFHSKERLSFVIASEFSFAFILTSH